MAMITMNGDMITTVEEADNSKAQLFDDFLEELNDDFSKFHANVVRKLFEFKTSLDTKYSVKPLPVQSVKQGLVSPAPRNARHCFTSATEIRCQEQAKGGLKFDVILADPAGTPPAPKRTQSPTRTKSVENIEEKLKAAEERRLSLEACKMATIAAKLSKIEEASKKKDEQTSVFITQTKEALDQKMETHIEKRDAYISDIKTKLKDHWDSIEKTRHTLEKQTAEVRIEVEERLKHASAQRDEKLKKIVDRLKDHEEQVKKVRASQQEKLAQLDNQIQDKIKQAELRRIDSLEKQKEKLKEQERRAEMVRQNKRLSSSQEEQNTASSG